ADDGEAAQRRHLPDDLRVVADVRGRRDERRDLADPLLATDLLELAVLVELVGEGDRVDRMPVLEQVEGGPVDLRVRLAVEVAAVDDVADRFDRVRREHHRPKHVLLRLQVLGWKRGDSSRRARCGRGHQGLVNRSRRAAATVWKGAGGDAGRRLCAGMKERMFACGADVAVDEKPARCGKFTMNSTSRTGDVDYARRISPQACGQASRYGLRSGLSRSAGV